MGRIPIKYVSVLILIAVFSSVLGKSYKGAELRTKESFTYGRFEVNYKPPAGEGILGSFFTYHDNISSVSEWNEIDIEIMGRYKDNVQFTTITPGQAIHDGHFYVPFNPHLGFHTYAFEWTPEYVAWFADGEEIYRQSGAHIASLQLAQKIMMNVWIPEYEDWAGIWDSQILPKFAYYDWVRYASYTPGNGNCGTDNNFTMEWRDDFNTFDSTRWDKASHTFQGNKVDFLPENVVFKDGKMILCLTDETDTGFTDKIPPYLLWVRGFDHTITLHFSEDLDSLSAENNANYFISGLTIEEIHLLSDQQTVELKVDTIDTTKTYSVVILGIKDKSPNQNKQMGQVIPVTIAKPLSFPLIINTGGGAIYDNYLADQVWDPSVEYGHMDGHSKVWPADNEINGTEQDSLYANELQAAVKYKIRVPDGVYSVTFHFAENEFAEAGQRVFEVFIEDSLVINKLDLFSIAGLHTAYDVEVNNIPVHDGIMDISLNNWVEHSLLNGLTIKQESTGIQRKPSGKIEGFQLNQNYPNPFGSASGNKLHKGGDTCISYSLTALQGSGLKYPVHLTLYNVLGQVVKELVNKEQSAGTYRVSMDSKNLPAGIYFYHLQAGSFSATRKMILLR